MTDNFWVATLSNTIGGVAAGIVVVGVAGWFGHRVARFSLMSEEQLVRFDEKSGARGAYFMIAGGAVFLVGMLLTISSGLSTIDRWSALTPDQQARVFWGLALASVSAVMIGVAGLNAGLNLTAIWVARTRQGRSLPVRLDPRAILHELGKAMRALWRRIFPFAVRDTKTPAVVTSSGSLHSNHDEDVMDAEGWPMVQVVATPASGLAAGSSAFR